MSKQIQKKSDMESLWDNFVQYGYLVRKTNTDGLKAWLVVKKHFPKIDFEWSNDCVEFYDTLRAANVMGDDDDEKNELWEPHHFLIQHGRIVKKNPEPNLQRLLQIAYNQGQFNAELEKDPNHYSEEMLKIYTDLKMSELSTYVDTKQQKMINKKLDKSMFNELFEKILKTFSEK